MGAIPAAVVTREGRARGVHPLNSFSALGPRADELIRDQTAIDVYAPFEHLREMGGSVVMMGVGLDSMTLLHYAEQLAGRALFIRWAVGPAGEVIRMCGRRLLQWLP
jgi:aminoglycoside 3-N-acetyltransferase